MNWEAPKVVEIRMDAEVGSYQEDFGGDEDPPFVSDGPPSRAPTSHLRKREPVQVHPHAHHRERHDVFAGHRIDLTERCPCPTGDRPRSRRNRPCSEE